MLVILFPATTDRRVIDDDRGKVVTGNWISVVWMLLETAGVSGLGRSV